VRRLLPPSREPRPLPRSPTTSPAQAVLCGQLLALGVMACLKLRDCALLKQRHSL
jgi:hypothetical protein